MADVEHELGAAELEMLRALWDVGPATVRQVMNYLHERGRELAYTTVQTVLTRLEQKAFVVSNKSDLAFVYRARISRERMSRSRLRTIAQQFYDGAAGPLILQLVRSERLTPNELAELAALIERLDTKDRGAGRQRR